MEVERYRQLRVFRYLQRIVFSNKPLAKKNQDCRCLVVLHLFYEKSWNEINEYLKNLSPYHFDLIITVTQNRASQETIERIRKEYPKAQIIVTANKGFDLLPFLTVIKDIDLDQYDVVFKLQSKSTKRKYIYIYKQLFLRRDWFVNLYEGILSAKNVHKTIDSLYNQKETGLVAAANLIVKDPQHKANLVQRMAEKRGLVFFDHYSFVAGTCFAVKAQCLRPIQEMHFENEEFTPWIQSRGMSFAHFIERYLCISVLLQGYLMKGNQANTIRRTLLNPLTQLMNHYSSERLFNEDIDLDDEWFLWQMDNRLIKYKFDWVKFSDMTWNIHNKLYPVVDGAPYKYVSQGDVAGYDAYCKLHEVSGAPLMTRERFDHLIESINQNGFDERKIIIVNNQNTVLDGQHRACVLAAKYGVDSNIRVLKIWDIKRNILRFLRRSLTAIRKLLGR